MKNIYILTDFLVWLESRNYNDKTIEKYERYLTMYNQYLLDKYNISINDPEEFTIGMIDNYIQLLQAKYAPKTINLIIASIRSYMKYCDRMDYCQYDYRRISMIKEDDKEAVFVSKEDYESIIARISMQEKDRLTRLRNILICKLLLQWMFRVSELIHIKLTDFTVIGKEVYVQIVGKGKIVRSVAVSPKVYNQILEYCKLCKSNDWYIFVSHANNSYWKKLSRNSVASMIKLYRENCWITKKITPHSFRHGGATILVSTWSPLNTVQKILWHKNITTTQIYLHVVDRDKVICQSVLFD